MKGKKPLTIIVILALLLAAGGLIMEFFNARWLEAAETAPLEGTTEQLDNPDRGFYLIHGIEITDEMDPADAVNESFSWDWGRRLALVELNLCNYSGGEISQAGLDNIAAVFNELRMTGMRYIIRFVYDWDGKNMEREPVRREIVQRHMEQTAPIVNVNSDQIYTMQGLFVGNWGEMNGTRYTGTEHWRALAATLAETTDQSIFLSVRMPMQWRRICGETEADEAAEGIRQRMGLFNDGMMGSWSDLGTYGETAREDADYADIWRPEDELAFQEELCRTVPNGGEAVLSKDGCPLDSALEYLRIAHVSYLNEDYDKRVLQSWASETVSGGIWDGTDGLSYVRAHLGYRFTATDADVQYSYLGNRLTVTVKVKNEGFAPAYFPLDPALVVMQNGEEKLKVSFSGDLSDLWGGNHTDERTLRAELPLSVLEHGDYDLALRMDSDRGRILMANSGRISSGEILIGRIREK